MVTPTYLFPLIDLGTVEGTHPNYPWWQIAATTCPPSSLTGGFKAYGQRTLDASNAWYQTTGYPTLSNVLRDFTHWHGITSCGSLSLPASAVPGGVIQTLGESCLAYTDPVAGSVITEDGSIGVIAKGSTELEWSWRAYGGMPTISNRGAIVDDGKVYLWSRTEISAFLTKRTFIA